MVVPVPSEIVKLILDQWWENEIKDFTAKSGDISDLNRCGGDVHLLNAHVEWIIRIEATLFSASNNGILHLVTSFLPKPAPEPFDNGVVSAFKELVRWKFPHVDVGSNLFTRVRM